MRPMLAVSSPSEGLTFPLMYSAKLDGVRCVIEGGVAKSRKLEEIPNRYVQHMLGGPWLEGLDGELCVGAPYADNVFTQTMSGVMSYGGEPDFTFYVFDFWNGPESMGYGTRYLTLLDAFQRQPYVSHPRLQLLEHTVVNSMDELTAAQEDHIERGYEGLILRDPDGPYKHGRSTAKQGWMMKLKRFTTGEARVIGVVEMMHNENELLDSALGLAKRSTAQSGLVPAGVLGALTVVDCESNVPFSIGSGFSAQERLELWQQQSHVLGRVVKYKHFEIGVKTAPRFPTFLGFRDERDMGEPA